MKRAHRSPVLDWASCARYRQVGYACEARHLDPGSMPWSCWEKEIAGRQTVGVRHRAWGTLAWRYLERSKIGRRKQKCSGIGRTHEITWWSSNWKSSGHSLELASLWTSELLLLARALELGTSAVRVHNRQEPPTSDDGEGAGHSVGSCLGGVAITCTSTKEI